MQSPEQGIVWLASYPKSGNTWLRVFLANFLSPGNSPVDINRISLGANPARDRLHFDQIVGLESSDLTASEIDRYHAAACRSFAESAETTVYIKTHDACVSLESGHSLFPADVTRGAVCVVRNPLDVAVSFAHHLGSSLDAAISAMGYRDFVSSAPSGHLHWRLPERTFSWSENVNSWLDQKAIPVHTIRYEDMLQEPEQAFGGCLRFLGLERDPVRIAQAIECSSFGVLERQEAVAGFRERPRRAKKFFRNGRSGEWRNVLNADQISEIVRNHLPTMARLGYGGQWQK